MDLQNITFYSVPFADVDRTITFAFNEYFPSVEELPARWNDPTFGHVFFLGMEEGGYAITNNSHECMVLLGYNVSTRTSFCVETWAGNETKIIPFHTMTQGGISEPIVCFQDAAAFTITAYLHRKKTTNTHYARKEIVVLPKGVYFGVGSIAAALNQKVTMRGERNGYIYHFITKKGKLSIESSHKQPEPSFMEIVPMLTGLGMPEESVLRLRTKERVDFDYGVCNIL